MMKKLLGIILCCTLLLSCMPAMAAITGGLTVPSVEGVENLYTVDLSGDAPALKLNGEAVDGIMTERGTVTINTDATTGEKSVKLTNGADHIPEDLYSPAIGVVDDQYSRWSIGSALCFDMGANAFNGNVLIKFKVKDELQRGDDNARYAKKPLHIGAATYINTSLTANGTKHDILYETGGALFVNEGTSNSLGAKLAANTWYDYTVLYNTAESKFKFWLDGVQMIAADGSEWFADDTALTAGMDKFNISTVINTCKDKSTGERYIDSFNGSTYFRDIAFGLYDEPTTFTTANRLFYDFEKNDFNMATYTDFGFKKYYQAKLNGTITPDNFGTEFINHATTTNSAVKSVSIVDSPAGAENAPGTGKVLKMENMGNDFHGAQLRVGYGYENPAPVTGNYANNNAKAFEENVVAEFDVCNASTSENGEIYPFYAGTFESSGYSPNPGYTERDMLKFDKTGIYAQGNLIKAGSTINKWYHVKILYAPTADAYKVWIDGEPMSYNDSEWFTNNAVDNSIVVYLKLCVGDGLSMPAGTIAYFDNFEIYQLDNYVSFDAPGIFTDMDNDAFVFEGVARNKTDDSITAVPVLAIYDQLRGYGLKKVTIGEPVTVAPGAVESLETSAFLDGLNTICSAKAFIWDTTFADMKPFDADMFFGRSMEDGVFTAASLKTPARAVADAAEAE